MEFPRECANPKEMQALGQELAAELGPGGVLALSGDLGAGKTELVKGLALGLGHEGVVTSPTFTLLQEYHGGRRALFHFDFYRVERAEEILEVGWDELLESGGIVAAEWAERFPELFPEGTLALRIEIRPEGGRGVEVV